MVLAGGYPPGENIESIFGCSVAASRPKTLASHCFTRVCRKLLRRGPKSDERRFEVMRIQTFVIGSVLALALFLFAQQRPETTQPGGFRDVVDLTHSLPTPNSEAGAQSAYRLQSGTMIGSTRSSSSVLDSSSIPASEQFATRM